MSVVRDPFDPARLGAILRDPRRLGLLERAALLDGGADADFERWVALTARALRAPAAHLSFARQTPFCAQVVATGERVVVADTAATERPGAAEALAHGIRSYAGTPILVEDLAVGTLCAYGPEPRAWTEDDLALLADIAGAIAVDVRLRLAAEELRRSNLVVASHNRVHALIAGGEPLPDVLREIATGIEQYDERLRASVLVLDAESGTLGSPVAPTLPQAYLDTIDGLEVSPGNGSCGAAAYHGREVITADTETDPRWAPYRDVARAHGLRSCWSTPILGECGEVLGTFGVYAGDARTPTEADTGFLRDAARLAGIAIGRDRAGAALLRQATHDALTGLPNRALLLDRLGQALARARRSGRSLAVLAVDVDRLQLVNDTLGQAAGDDLLRLVAERLAGTVRPGDTVARFDGDQFLVIAEEVEAVEADAIAGRITTAIAAPAVVGTASELTSTASVGVAVVHGNRSPEEAIRVADDALRRAQDDGGNRHQHSDRPAAAPARRRLVVESHLRGALERGELHIVGQPVLDLGSSRLRGTEALLRWTHPELGDVSPAEFIPIAEQVGLIVEIGAWVLREACTATARLEAAVGHRVDIGVNVSPRQLRDPGFPDLVCATLAATGLTGDRLVIEITETALLGSDPATAAALAGLKGLGARLALDDFGTGFSSLSMVKDHPIDGIKIDRSFVQGLPSDERSAAIVSAVVGMAKGLGRRVTAEGIETAEQLAFLTRIGCHDGQGYLLARPVAYAELEARYGAAKAEEAR